MGAVTRAKRTLMGRWKAELGARRGERVQLGRRHIREIRPTEEAIDEAYQPRIKGVEERAERAARTLAWGGWSGA